jgi:hypothetical protein
MVHFRLENPLDLAMLPRRPAGSRTPAALRSLKQAQKLRALELDLHISGPRMVEPNDVVESGPEFLPRLGVLLVDGRGVGSPQARDFTDGKIFPGAEPEKLDALHGLLAGFPGPVLLEGPRLAKNGFRPGPIEDPRHARRIVREALGILAGGGLSLPLAPGAPLEAERHVPGDAVKEGPEGIRLVLAYAVQHAAAAKALQEDFLYGIIQLPQEPRVEPPVGQVSPHGGFVPPSKIVPVPLGARSGASDEDPAGGLRVRREYAHCLARGDEAPNNS